MKLVRTVSHDHDTLALRARTGLSHEGAQDALAGRSISRASDQLIGGRLRLGDEGLGSVGRLPVAPHPGGKPPTPPPVHPVHPIKPPVSPKPPVSHPAPVPPRTHPIPRPGLNFGPDAGLGGRFSR